jgi:hypothetical protein
MIKIRPYLLDIIIGAIFILLPGIRGYSNRQIHEYAFLLLIYGYIVYLHHKNNNPIIEVPDGFPINAIYKSCYHNLAVED